MARIFLASCVAAISISTLATTFAQQQVQVADLDYDTTIAHPAYSVQHPAVLFDEGHHNFHTSDGYYKPFVTLISNDGYRVTINRKAFSKESLGPSKILVIANCARRRR